MRALVYLVKFPNGKKYVGITSKSMKRRKIQHYSDARKGSTYKFHKALLKYEGKEEWIIIENKISWKRACEIEQSLIKEFDSFKKGYNSTIGGEGTPGRKYSKEQRIELASRRGTAKKLYVFDLKGSFVGEFNSQVECQIFFQEKGIKMDIRNIHNCLTGHKRSCYGHFFSYNRDFKPIPKRTRGKSIRIKRKNGKETVVGSIDKAAKELGVCFSTIKEHLINKKPLRSGAEVSYAA